MALGTRGACLPAETAALPGRPGAGNPPVPTWVAPRQPGVNLLSVGKASRTLLPNRVCSEPDSSETETSRTPGPTSPHGILPGFTFYGEVLEGWAERSLGRAGDVASLLPPSSSPRVSPAPPRPRCWGPVPDPREARKQTSWGGWNPGPPAPPRRKPVNL